MGVPFRLVIVSLSLTTAAVFAQAPVPVRQKAGVRELTEEMSGMVNYVGVVGSIDTDGMVVVETSGRGEGREHTFVPINLLRQGKYIPTKSGWYTYRWQDVKAGDTVMVEVLWDPDDKVQYCMQVCIRLRPKEKLPKSQEPDRDDYFAARSVYNDIENGLDVSDEEVKKAFPPQFRVNPKTGEKKQSDPGGLPKQWQAKLDAIRAKKKEKDLKATPPEKK